MPRSSATDQPHFPVYQTPEHFCIRTPHNSQATPPVDLFFQQTDKMMSQRAPENVIKAYFQRYDNGTFHLPLNAPVILTRRKFSRSLTGFKMVVDR